jgi:hypothetical protein
LEAPLGKGESAARSQTRARMLLKAAAGLQDKDIIQALNISCKGGKNAPAVWKKARKRH